MTTIAYRDGVLASDSEMTFDGVRGTRMPKIYREGPLLIGFAGALSNFERFRSWVRAGMKGEFESRDGNVFIMPPEGPVVIWGASAPWREVGEFWALGSGERIALGAMTVGASAEEAVRAAIAWDTASGGAVVSLRRGPVLHAADCALHNAPALPVGSCDCGAI